MPLTDEDFFAPGEKPAPLVTPGSTLTDDDFYPMPAAPENQAPVKDPSMWDQVKGSYFDIRAAFGSMGGLSSLEKAKGIESGELVVTSTGLVVGKEEIGTYRSGVGPLLAAKPEEAAETAKQLRGDAAEGFATGDEFRKKGEAIPFSEGTKDFVDESRGVSMGQALVNNPGTVIGELGLRSSANMVPIIAGAAAGGSVGGPIGAAVGAGAASGRLEYVTSVVDGLRKAGVDLSDPAQIEAALNNQELMTEIEGRAATRGFMVGGVDALTAGIAGKMLTPFIKSAGGRIAGNLAAQSVVQSVGGGGGEYLAQKATGEHDPRAIGAEMAGEFISAGPESYNASREYITGKKAAKAADTGPLADAKAAEAGARDPVEVLAEEQDRVRKEIAAKGGDALDQELAAALAESNVSPEMDATLFARRRKEAELQRVEKERQQKEKDDAKRAKEGKEVGEFAGESVGDAVSKTLGERRKAQGNVEREFQETAPTVTTRIPNMDPNTRGAFKTVTNTVFPPSDPSPREQAQPAKEQVEQEASDQVIRNLQEDRAYDARETEVETQKNRDFAAAQGQVELERGDTNAKIEDVNTGAPPAPTLGDVSPALRTLAERRAREKEQSVEPVRQEREGSGQPAEVPAAQPTRSAVPAAAPAPQQREQVDPGPRQQAPTQATGQVDDAAAPASLDKAKAATGRTADGRDVQDVQTDEAQRRPVLAADPAAGALVGDAKVSARIDAIVDETVEQRPSDGQARAGNYRKPRIRVFGFDISVENPRGSERRGTNKQGRNWAQRLRDHYGYIKGTSAADGGQLDVFVGDRPVTGGIFVVDQVDQTTGQYDEAKVLMGYANEAEAVKAYKRNYEAGWKVGNVTQMSVQEFREWTRNGDTTKPLKPVAASTPATQEQVEEAARSARIRGRDDTIRERNTGESNVESTDPTAQRPASPAERQAVSDDRSAVRSGAASVRPISLGERRERGVSPDNAERARQNEGQDNDRQGSNERARGSAQRETEAERVRAAADRGVSKQPAAEADNRSLGSRRANTARGASATTDGGRNGPSESHSGLDRKALKKVITGIQEENPGIDPVLVDDVRALPQEAYDYLVDQGRIDKDGKLAPNVKALFVNGDIHIFTENVKSEEDLRKTLLHEYVGHKGMRALFGEKFNALLDDVFANASDTKTLDLIKSRYPNATDQAVAEEYIAYIAESGTDVSMLNRAIAFVRRALRKLGWVESFTENDIKALLMKARTQINEQAGQRTEPALRVDDDPPAPPGPLRAVQGMAASMEAQANYRPTPGRIALNLVTDPAQGGIEGLLSTIPLRFLKDFVSQKMPTVAAFVREQQAMSGRRNELMTETDQIANRFLKYVTKNKDQGRILGELMHAATLSQVDPSGAFRPFKDVLKMTADERAENARRRAAYDALTPYYDRLDAEGKGLFNTLRDSYAKQRRMMLEGVLQRIQASEASGQSKKALMDKLRQQFEDGHTRGPYFPLTRFGEYFAAAKNAKGETIAFSRFEKPSEQRAWVAQMKAEGFEVKAGKRVGDKQTMTAVDPKFAMKVTEWTADIDPSLADEIWQMYLRSMPEMSMRKHFIHRKGRLGFAGDALRAYGHTMFHGAHQLARLEHGYKLDNHLRQIKEESDAVEYGDPDHKWATPLYKELVERNEWIKNPESSRWANLATSFGFAWYLAGSSAAGIVNLTQTAMVALPFMGAKFGYVNASRELLSAAKQLAAARGSLGEQLTGEERAAWNEAKRAGVFEQTQAHSLAGVAEGGLNYDSRWRAVSKGISWFFHTAEEINRKVTFLASYRLAKAAKQPHQQALTTADDLTWDSHGDYNSTNRPRVMQGNIPKVLFLFRQYSVLMTYNLARAFKDSLPKGLGASDRARKVEARKRFAGLMGMTGLLAGATGLPMFWAVEAVLNAMFDDPDDPFDASDALREHLTESLGPDHATAITKGLIDGYTPLTFSSRVGLNSMWIRDQSKSAEGRELGQDIVAELAGPLPSVALDFLEASKLSDEDHGDRALELILPKMFKDPIKAFRYYREGVQNKKGDSLVEKDELTAKDIFLQANGFSPSRVTRAFDQSRAIKDQESAILKRGDRLVDRYYLAAKTADSAAIADVTEEILAYNAKNPEVAIDGDRIENSIRSREESHGRAINGVVVDKRLGRLHTQKNITRDLRER